MLSFNYAVIPYGIGMSMQYPLCVIGSKHIIMIVLDSVKVKGLYDNQKKCTSTITVFTYPHQIMIVMNQRARLVMAKISPTTKTTHCHHLNDTVRWRGKEKLYRGV